MRKQGDIAAPIPKRPTSSPGSRLGACINRRARAGPFSRPPAHPHRAERFHERYTPAMHRIAFLIALTPLTAFALAADTASSVESSASTDSAPAERPRMRQLAPTAAAGRPPDPHELVAARAELQRRFRDDFASLSSPARANAAVAALLHAATTEPDRRLKWLMLDEARELAADAGNAPAVSRALVLAAAEYDFDAAAEEYRTLNEIPLRLLDPPRAAALAASAEKLAARAEADGRRDLATSAQLLAMRGWERSGDIEQARAAAAKVRMLDPGREPGRR